MHYSLKLTGHKPQATSRWRISAFTLIEMSIVIAIIAVVIAGGMTIFLASLQKKQLHDTQYKLKAIQQALLDFRIANNRLPCPADVTLALTNTNFGLEAGSFVGSLWTPDAGNCHSGGTVNANYWTVLSPTGDTTIGAVTVSSMSSTAGLTVGMGVSGTGIPTGDSIAATPTSTPASPAGDIYLAIPATANAPGGITLTIGNNVEGMVPTASLNLSDDYALDGWGNRIMYTVDNRLTVNNALTPYPSVLAMSGTVNQASASVANLASTSGLSANMYVYGNGVPVSDVINSITDGTTIALTTVMPGDGPNNVIEPLSFSTKPIPGTVILATDTTQRLTVNDPSGNSKSKIAAYVLVSFGPNGHGAFPRFGGTATRLSSGSDNSDELKNCDCTSAAVNNATIPGGVFVQKDSTLNTADVNNTFDDVVAYGTRSDLRSPTE